MKLFYCREDAIDFVKNAEGAAVYEQSPRTAKLYASSDEVLLRVAGEYKLSPRWIQEAGNGERKHFCIYGRARMRVLANCTRG
jgi:hypothetical protein